MNKEEPYRDQAERLKQRIQKINEQMEDGDKLPPREQIHRYKKQKTKWKLKYPVIRLLVLFFILLPIISFSVISYLDGKNGNRAEKATVDPVGYETINLESSKDSEEKNTNKSNDKMQVGSDNSEELNATEGKNAEPQVVDEQQETSNNAATTVPNADSTQASSNQIESDKNTKPVAETTKNKTRIIYHKVKQGETLYRISDNYYHSPKGMEIIMKANHLSSNQLIAGQVLKIPLNN